MAKQHFQVDLENKTVTYTRNITNEEKLEVARYQQLGYTAVAKSPKKVSPSKGKDKDYYLSMIPDEEGKQKFIELCNKPRPNKKGPLSFTLAKEWAKKAYPDVKF